MGRADVPDRPVLLDVRMRRGQKDRRVIFDRVLEN